MKEAILIASLALISSLAWGEFSCPDEAIESCLQQGDLICPKATRCVAEDTICIDKQTCGSGNNFVCESDYNKMLGDYKNVVDEHNELASENEDLRVMRLERKNCVINAASLKAAISCVR
ncbi:MAG: hypothetical protein GQ538_13035 [Xanthomonadales bacterium]|nr:hypothetical protein [Xanthomonadales bacterium]